MTSIFQTYLDKRLLVVLLLGFSSGLPIALTASTLQAWYTVSGIDIVGIGLLSMVGQPYVYKFLWAPLMDRYVIPGLGRRRGWMCITQVGLIISIAAMGLFQPQSKPMLLALLALVVAFLSASQDITVDAYRADILNEQQRGLGAAYTVYGYRVAMLVSGGLALYLAARYGWRQTYFFMAACGLIGLLATLWANEPELPQQQRKALNWRAVTIEPWREFMKRDKAIALLLLIVIYKLGDAFTLSLSTTFLIRGIGFSLNDVAVLNKVIVMIATLTGVFAGGALMTRLGHYRSLLLFGLLQALSNLTYMLLAMIGHSFSFAAFAVFFEHFCGGMGTTAFLAFLMSLCDKRYSATQFALFSALSAIGRVFVGPFAGLMVKDLGWVQFYFWTFMIGLPGIFIVWLLRFYFKQTTDTSLPSQAQA